MLRCHLHFRNPPLRLLCLLELAVVALQRQLCATAAPVMPEPGVPATALHFLAPDHEGAERLGAEFDGRSTMARSRCRYGIHDHTRYSILGLLVVAAAWATVATWLWSRKRRSAANDPMHVLGGLAANELELGPDITSASQKPATSRRPHLDTAKFVLMVLVVATHCKELHRAWPAHHAVMAFINPFCTRCFALVSGLVCDEPPSTHAMQQLMFRLAAPLVLFCVIVEPILLPLVLGDSFAQALRLLPPRAKENLTQATAGATWYMFALMSWKVWGWMLMPLGPRARLLTSFAFAAVGGYVPMTAFKLGQALTSFPAFVMGQLLPYGSIVKLFPWGCSTAFLGSAILGCIFAFGLTDLGIHFLIDLPMWGWSADLYQQQLAACGAYEASLIWVRGLFRQWLEISKSCLFLFLVCPHGNKGLVTELGAHTIYPFFLHYAVALLAVQCFASSGLSVPSAPLQLLGVGSGIILVARWAVVWSAMFAAAACVVALLSAKWVRMVFAPCLQPRWLEALLAQGPDRRGGGSH